MSEKRLGTVPYFSEYVGPHAVIRLVQSDFEPDCPRVHSVSVWIMYGKRPEKTRSTTKRILIWKMIPWKLDKRWFRKG